MIIMIDNVNWPPRSCDVRPLNYFIFGYVKIQGHKNNTQSISEQDEHILAISEMKPHHMSKCD